jgi:hypothetical protein
MTHTNEELIELIAAQWTSGRCTDSTPEDIQDFGVGDLVEPIDAAGTVRRVVAFCPSHKRARADDVIFVARNSDEPSDEREIAFLRRYLRKVLIGT